MNLTANKSVLPARRTLCLHYPQALTRERFEAFAETCLEFTPQLALRETHTLFLEVSASLHLFSEENLPTLVRAKALRFGIPHPRIVIADEPGIALALARYTITGSTSATLSVPYGADRMEILNPLPLDALYELVQPFFDPEEARDEDKRAKVSRVLELLRKLGLRTLEDFGRLPARQLPARFGREGAEISLQLRNPLPAVWPVWAPPELVSERFEIDAADPLAMNGCGDLGGLLQALRIPLDRACERLRVRGLKASRLKILLTPDYGEPREWDYGLSVPQGTPDSIFPLIRDRIDQELQGNPFESTISTLQLTILETAPGGGTQRDFFSSKEESAEAWDALLGRLTLKLGEENVFRARLENFSRPEAAWSRELRPNASTDEVAPTDFLTGAERPTRLFETPIELRVRTDGDGKSWFFPLQTTPGAKAPHWQVVSKLGPERITGEWWKRQDALARDYYRIETQTEGECLWVYITPDQRVFLHGLF
jgi:protein ImuB